MLLLPTKSHGSLHGLAASDLCVAIDFNLCDCNYVLVVTCMFVVADYYNSLLYQIRICIAAWGEVRIAISYKNLLHCVNRCMNVPMAKFPVAFWYYRAL